MWVYENAANGYRETVSNWSMLWAFLFGWVYLAIKGLWVALVANVLATTCAVLLVGPGGIAVAMFGWLVTAAVTPRMLRRRYLRAGWKLVAEG